MTRFQKRHVLYLMLCIGVALLDFTWINKANQTYAKDYLNESLAFLFVLVIEKITLHVFLIPLMLFGSLYKIFSYLSGERFETLVLQLRGA